MQEDRIEQLFIKTILQKRPLAVKLFDTILQKEHFDDGCLYSIYITAKDYYGKYNNFPTKDIILTEVIEQIEHKYIRRNDDKAKLAEQKEIQEVQEIMKNVELMEYEINQEKYYLETMTEYLKEQEQKRATMKIVDCIESKRSIFPTVERLSMTETLEISGAPIVNTYLTGSEFVQLELGEINYYLYPIVPEDSIVLVVGQPGVGKTFFLMSLCDAITKGRDFGIWKNLIGEKKILYIDAEMPYKIFQKNIRDLNVNDNFMSYCKSYTYMKTGESMVLTNSLYRKEVMEYAVKNDIKIIVFDNLSVLAPEIDENKKQDYDPLNQFFLELRAVGVTSIVVHHTNKSRDQSGHKSKENNVDNIMYLMKPKDYDKDRDNLRAVLSFDKARLCVEEKGLMNTREVQYQKGMRGRYEWTFGKPNLVDDPDFINALVDGKTQTELSEMYNVSTSTIGNWTQKAKDKEYIKIIGNHPNRVVELLEKGREITGGGAT